MNGNKVGWKEMMWDEKKRSVMKGDEVEQKMEWKETKWNERKWYGTKENDMGWKKTK